jgi:colicin import membrane protein
MPRKLKVYQTSQGFYDLAIAAPSMKAALEAWGSNNNLFHHGFAKESDDSDVIAAAMANPGVVLRRPVGSKKAFKEHSELPTAASLASVTGSEAPVRMTSAKKKARRTKLGATDAKAERAAVAAFEKEERKRELQRQKEEATAAKARERRKAAMEKVEVALEEARAEHERRMKLIEKDREAVDRRAHVEDERWAELQTRLEQAIRKAGN